MASIETDNKPIRARLIASGLVGSILLFFPLTGHCDSSTVQPHSAASLSANPSIGELEGCQVFAGPLVAAKEQSPQPGENAALSAALKEYAQRTEPDDLSSIEGFLQQYPQSSWKVSLLSNLGTVYYESGHFSKAMDAWETAWNEGKSSKDPAVKLPTDWAVSQLAKMNARLGRADRLDSLFAELKGRKLNGPASQYLLGAREARWLMKHRPEISFRCGPLALDSIARFKKLPLKDFALIEKCKSTINGVSLATVKKLADSIGLNFQLAKRSPGAAIILPAVVHWNLNHYGALLSREGNVIVGKDPTFGGTFTVTPKALNAEASGYFLVPAGPLPAGWQRVSMQEAARVWGKGVVSGPDPNPTGPCDNQSGGDGGDGCGMSVYSMHTMLVSLYIKDKPLLFRSAVGRVLDFTISYSQRGVQTSAVETESSYMNMRQWTHNWFSYIQDNPTISSTSELDLYMQGGGIRPYYFETGQTVSEPQTTDQSTLTVVSSGTLANYVINYANGAQHCFTVTTPVDGPGRMVFLSKIVDSASNQILLNYDGSERLTSVTGSSGSLAFTYNTNSSIAMVTASNVVSGSSWSTSLGYNSSGQLDSITDAAGMTSGFAYDSGTSDFIDAMTTPYGTTTFTAGDENTELEPTIPVRWLQATDPIGATERLEFSDGLEYGDQVSDSDPTNTVPINLPASCVSVTNEFLSDRDAFYWSKKAFMDGPGDYTKAKITHFLHLGDSATVSGVIESVKEPYENRVWYFYPGQSLSYETGTSNQPIAIARVLVDSSTTTQIYQYQYNAMGNVTQYIDPVGRTTSYSYAANNVDVTGVYQENPAGTTLDPFGNNADQLAAYSYNSQHERLTDTNAAGQTGTNTYNAQGEITSRSVVQSGTSETTTWNYDGDGFLTSVVGPGTSGTLASFAYDSHNRLQSVTDSQGYQKTYAYDGIDRLTSITDVPDGTTDQYIYNRKDIEWYKDRSNRWTHYLHDQLGRLVYVVDPAGHSTQYQYCPCGALTGIVDGNGNTTSFILDDESRVTEKIYADSTTTSYAYDPASRLQTITDAKSQVTTYGLNLDNTLGSVSYSGSVSTPSVAYTYNSSYPRLTTMADSVSGTTTYNYNLSSITGSPGGGMVASVVNTGSCAYTLSYGYDSLGHIISRAIDGGTNTETTAYDGLGRVTQVANVTGTYGYTPYNALNLVDHINYPNGQVVQYGYYTSGASEERLETITNQGPVTDGTISQFAYGYNPAGDITSWTQQADTSTPVSYGFGYDGGKELLSAIKTSSTGGSPLDTYAYRYDSDGNRLGQQINYSVTSSAYNNLNQVTSVSGTGLLTISGSLSEPGTVTAAGSTVTTDSNNNFTIVAPVVAGSNGIPIAAADVTGTNVTNNTLVVNVTSGTPIPSLQYDQDGNLTYDGTHTYVWDVANRLVKIWYGTVGSSASTTMNYDGVGRRIQIVETGSSGSVTCTKNLIWDGMRIREERNASNSVTKMYFANGVQIGGTNYYYTRDHLGSIREITDANQIVQARFDYDPYGNQTQLSGTIAVDFGFTGLYYHQPSGLNLAPYRAYSASLARWISRDPLSRGEMREGTDLYAYVVNNPINALDPLGLNAISTTQLILQSIWIGLQYGVPGSEFVTAANAAPDVAKIILYYNYIFNYDPFDDDGGGGGGGGDDGCNGGNQGQCPCGEHLVERTNGYEGYKQGLIHPADAAPSGVKWYCSKY